MLVTFGLVVEVSAIGGPSPAVCRLSEGLAFGLKADTWGLLLLIASSRVPTNEKKQCGLPMRSSSAVDAHELREEGKCIINELISPGLGSH